MFFYKKTLFVKNRATKIVNHNHVFAAVFSLSDLQQPDKSKKKS